MDTETDQPESKPSSDTDAGVMPSVPEDRTDNDTEETAQGAPLFGGLSASDAAKLRWQRQRDRESQQTDSELEQAGDEVQYVRVPVRTGEIIKRLAKDAKQGNVQAARELRAYLNEVASDAENSVSDLDRKTRRKVLDRLLAEIEEEEQEAVPPGDATPASAGTPVSAV
jgi:hypothetical protein